MQKENAIGAESAMKIIFEYVYGEPYEHEDLSARADAWRYVWEHEQSAWLDEISKIKEDAKTR